MQHPLGAKIWFSEKVDLGGYDSTLRSELFSPNAEGIAVDYILV